MPKSCSPNLDSGFITAKPFDLGAQQQQRCCWTESASHTFSLEDEGLMQVNGVNGIKWVNGVKGVKGSKVDLRLQRPSLAMITEARSRAPLFLFLLSFLRHISMCLQGRPAGACLEPELVDPPGGQTPKRPPWGRVRVQGSGVQGSWFRGSGFRVQSSGVQGFGVRVSGFRGSGVQGSGFS